MAKLKTNLLGLWSIRNISTNITNEKVEQIDHVFQSVLKNSLNLDSLEVCLIGHQLMEIGGDFLYLGALYEIQSKSKNMTLDVFQSFYSAFIKLVDGIFAFSWKLRDTIKLKYREIDPQSYVYFFLNNKGKAS